MRNYVLLDIEYILKQERLLVYVIWLFREIKLWYVIHLYNKLLADPPAFAWEIELKNR